MDWSRGYTARFRVFEVDRRTWADREQLAGFASATLARDSDGDAPLIESGSLVLDRAPEAGDLPERYLRLVMVAEQAGSVERVDVCTLLCSSSGGTVERGLDRTDIRGNSVLWPASRRCLERGSWADAGEDGAQLAADMLAEAIDAPVDVEGAGFTLAERIVFDLGSTVLSCAWQLLRAGNHTIAIDGRGRVTVRPVPTRPALVLDRAGARLVRPGVQHALDWSEVPNRYIAVEGDAQATAVNDDAQSATSTVARGFVVDPGEGVDTSPTRVDGETLEDYARRRLQELSVVRDERTYVREWWPGVHPGDLVRSNVAGVGIDGDLRVQSQSVSVGRGITITEKAFGEVRLWQA